PPPARRRVGFWHTARGAGGGRPPPPPPPPPPNATSDFRIIAVFPSSWMDKWPFRNWGSQWGHIWVRIDDPAAVPRIAAGLRRYPYRHPGNWKESLIRFTYGDGGLTLVPLRVVHFHNASIGEGGASRRLIDILGLVGLAALVNPDTGTGTGGDPGCGGTRRDVVGQKSAVARWVWGLQGGCEAPGGADSGFGTWGDFTPPADGWIGTVGAGRSGGSQRVVIGS
ncbi:MAG: hypothetical protein ABF479_11145, partial [Gluconacetobacter sp.]